MKSSKHIFAWHHWCGLVVGLFLLVMSLSGSVLAFSEELESLSDKQARQVSNPSGTFAYDASFKQVRSSWPDWEIRLYDQPAPNEALVYELRKKEQSKKVFVHPVNGKVLQVNEAANKQLHRRLLLLHYTLFAGTAGKILVFCIGVLFLITLLTGLYVYRKSIVRVLRFKVHYQSGSLRAKHSSLHRIVGVWSLLFNLLIVVSGLFVSGGIALNALKPAGPSKNEPVMEIRSLDAVRENLGRQLPDFQIHLLRIRPGSGQVQVSGRFRNDPFYYGKYYSRITVAGSDAVIDKVEALRDQPLGKRLLSFAGPLHFGNYGGLPVKVLYCLLGLTPALLSITGFVIWKTRGSKQKRKPVDGQQKRDVSRIPFV